MESDRAQLFHSIFVFNDVQFFETSFSPEPLYSCADIMSDSFQVDV